VGNLRKEIREVRGWGDKERGVLVVGERNCLGKYPLRLIVVHVASCKLQGTPSTISKKAISMTFQVITYYHVFLLGSSEDRSAYNVFFVSLSPKFVKFEIG
jgi:hypothetical protein